MKMLKSKKALSPVVASIILIAVTVAVSIAVAAWMGALTIGFTSTEQLTFTNYQWDTTGDVEWFVCTVKNTGSGDLSIQEVRIDGVAPATTKYSTTGSAPWTTFAAPLLLAKGSSVSFNLTRTSNFSHGVTYEVTVITAKGNAFGPYIKTAP